MKVSGLLALICASSLAACSGERTAQAGGEPGSSGDYQPLPAQQTQAPADIRGTLRSINMQAHTFAVTLESGMDQTFIFDQGTSVTGLDGLQVDGKSGSVSTHTVQSLVGKRGSEVVVRWRGQGEDKLATAITVQSDDATQKGALPVRPPATRN